MSADDFLDRVFRNLPRPGSRFEYAAWRHAGRPTQEGVGVLPASGVDVGRMAAAVLDLDHYTGNIDYVVESRRKKLRHQLPPTRASRRRRPRASTSG